MCPTPPVAHRLEAQMNIRTSLFVWFSLSLALLAGCTSTYRNVDVCKDKMRAEYPNATSAPLTLTASGAAYHGARVVVRGDIATPPKPPATKKTVTGAAAECTFAADTLTGFRWLAPAALVPKPPAEEE
jgi:hypothetical protein